MCSDSHLEATLGTESSHARPRPTGSATQRLVYALVLIPIVPALSIIGVMALDTLFGAAAFAGAFDELRWFHLFFSILWVAATIRIWRSAVLWTLGRRWLTALVAMIPFVQVVYARPLWTGTGCRIISDEMLRTGQHEVGIALWVWLSIWVWWGWEKIRMSQESEMGQVPAIRVSPRVRRLGAAIGTIPFVVGVFCIVTVAFEDFLGASMPASSTFAATAIVAIAVWIILWRGEVVWSPSLVWRTVVSALVCFVLPIAVQWIFVEHADGFVEVALWWLPVIGWGVWMAATITYWPMRAEATRVDDLGPRCRRCGYPLRGLRATRCPECGDEPTLDELWAATIGPP